MKRKDFSNFHKLDNLTDEELYRRFIVLVVLIISILLVSIGSFIFFAPKIGFLFGLISVNRNPKALVDVLAPSAPVFVDPPEAVNLDSITLSGSAEPGSTVKLFVNGPEKQSTLADLAGAFTFSGVKLTTGRNTIFARATDKNGNESATSETLLLELDKNKPDIKIDSPADGSTVKNLDKRITIKGNVNEKAQIKINGKLAVQKSDLSFEFLLGVDEGDVKITIEATDLAGNKKEEILNIKYEKKSS